MGDSCFTVAEAGVGAGFRARIVTCLAGPEPALAFVLDFEGLEGNVEAALPEATGGGVDAGGSGRLSRTKFPFLNSESRSLFLLLPLPLPAPAVPRPPLPPLPPPPPARSRWDGSSRELAESAYLRTGCVSRVKGTNFDTGDFVSAGRFRLLVGGLISSDDRLLPNVPGCRPSGGGIDTSGKAMTKDAGESL